MIRVAVVGLGVGEVHARAYAAADDAELRFLHDLDRQRADRLAAELGVTVADSYQEILSDDRIDAVSIASFDDRHHEQVLAALESGKHVFVEKPLCRTVGEARELKRAWRARPGLALSSNLVLRAAPLYQWIRARREAGELGRLYAFDGDYLYGRLWKITEGWRKDVEDYSVLLGGGVHLIDLMLWITGERPARVRSVGNRIATEGTAFRYRDFAASTFEFPSGLVGRITANFGCVHPHHHVVRVFGTTATVLYDDAGPRVHETRDSASHARDLDVAPLPSSKGALIPAFLRTAATGAGVEEAGQRELDLISVCVAADRALQEGAPVDIEYV